MSKKIVKKTEAVAAPAITKAPKTILDGGMTYALVSRTLNAMSAEDRTKAEAGDQVTLTDGRGMEQKVSKTAVELAQSLGAKYLATIKSAYLRPRMVIDWTTNKITLDESKVKIPFIKKPAEERAEAKAAE
jgi:hypothetical protein